MCVLVFRIQFLINGCNDVWHDVPYGITRAKANAVIKFS